MYATFAAVGPTYDGAAELAAPDAEQPFGLENAHRLAQRRLAHRELEEQLVLFGQHAAVGQFAAQDPPSQLISDLLGETAELNGWLCHGPSIYRTVVA